MTSAELTSIRNQYRDALLDDVLPFWIRNGVDGKHGGFISSLDRDGSVLDTDKSVWVQGRFAWLLATLHNEVGPNETWLNLAKHGLEFIDAHCFDPADGLMWFQVAEDGRPIRKRRYRFSETFACMANAAFAQATGDPDRATRAHQLFQTFRLHQREPERSPFPPKFTGTRPSKALGYPMMALNMAQVCREAGIDGDWNSEIDECIEEIRQDFVHEDIECVMETVATDGSRIENHFDGRTLNPGHAIEAAWFILEEARFRQDSELAELGCRMLRWMWKRGWDDEHGGLLYFVGVDNRPVQEYWQDMKFWWPHNEAIIATLMAWQLTGDDDFATMFRQVHEWTWAHFPDPDFGEWFGYLRRDGSVSNTLKGNLWKGPFHIPRMLLKVSQILDESESPTNL